MNRALFTLLGVAGLLAMMAGAKAESASDTGDGSGLPSSAPVTAEHAPAAVATLSTDDLKEYADQPEAVKRLIAGGLGLTRLNLFYKYGSADPKNGGMDCSGTVYYLLQQAGLKDVPRDSSEMYQWVWTEGHFQAVLSPNANTFELDRLKPGDLLFWTGTYHVERDPPVTHVMIYLGINRRNGHRVMLGASEGRPFDGISRYGVSVFDFQMPRARTSERLGPSDGPEAGPESRFVGYGAVPGLGEH
jgi:cell wall-associated NlpC family hydrolase